MKGLIAATLVAGAILGSTTAHAYTTSVVVDGTDQPWTFSTTPGGINYAYQYGDNDGSPPAVVSSGFSFTPGGTFTITYDSGLASPYGGTPYADANGDTRYVADNFGGSSGNHFPSSYMDPATYPIYLAELVGTFADASGQIVGTPFAIGDGPFSIKAPSGASELLLGINDDIFDDNTGSLVVTVSGPGLSAVPLPASAPLFGAALLALGVGGYSFRRKARVEA